MQQENGTTPIDNDNEWEQFRRACAKDCLASLIQNIGKDSFYNPDIPNTPANNMVENYMYAAVHAQRYADALVRALKHKFAWKAAPVIPAETAAAVALKPASTDVVKIKRKPKKRR